MTSANQKWIGPNDQVYEILEDTGAGWRVDIHHRRGKLFPNTWTFGKAQFDRMIETLPLRRYAGAMIEEQILREVQAGAESRLRRAAERKNRFEAVVAIRELVESSMPRPRMPNVRTNTVYRGHGNPHVAWKWVAARGMATLLVELVDWDRLMVSTFVTFPGITKGPQMVYRDQAAPEQIPTVVERAVHDL